jgi:hypothetical protein
LNEQVLVFSRPDKARGATGTQHLTVEQYDSLKTEMQTSGVESYEINLGCSLRLNPAFDAWHMGLPWWWTNPVPINSACSETELYLCKARQHLSSLLGAWEIAEWFF